MKKFVLLICFMVLIAFSTQAFSMSITAMDTEQNLAQALVGTGVTISNVSYTGASAASGYFTGGIAAGIGIDTGIVLTSGFASNLNGTSNTDDAITGDNGLGGASFLDALIPGYTTYDATILELDFVSVGSEAYFAYCFGSDEYNEYVGSNYNDVFGFFLDGTDVTDNVALIPGTSTPVAINNINNSLNSSLYNDNDPSDISPPPFLFEYDGFTDVFVASMTGLTPGGTHHLTIGIADAGDRILDSGVFLQAGSFGDEDPSIPEPGILFLLGSGLIGLIGLKRRFEN